MDEPIKVFISLGSQKFQFNRLLEKIDQINKAAFLHLEVFAQIGYSDYKPESFSYKMFLDYDQYAEAINKCELLITHAGTGAIMGGVKGGKKVIAVPRLVSYSEHVDDHQVQIVKQFEEMGIIEACYDLNNLEQMIMITMEKTYQRYLSNTQVIMDDLKGYIDNLD